MPEARNEMAMGMKRTVLNTVAQRTCSDRTAKTRPRMVTTVGATTTQITLFFTARSVEVSVKIWW